MSYNEGDLVRYTKGRVSVTAPLVAGGFPLRDETEALYLEGFDHLPYLHLAERGGWSVELVEKAAPPLPTEPGWYSAREARQSHMGDWHTDNAKAFCLNSQGNWVDVGWGGPSTLDGPFTRLEPVPVTVQKVIDYLVTEGCTGWLLNGIRKHFGLDK